MIEGGWGDFWCRCEAIWLMLTRKQYVTVVLDIADVKGKKVMQVRYAGRDVESMTGLLKEWLDVVDKQAENIRAVDTILNCSTMEDE
jgi:hypothetical protein